MIGYVRPVVAAQTYRDADGAEFEYGDRWGSQGPPAESYSVDSHPERFAPLHEIADALIDHLRAAYEVEVTEDLSCARDLCHDVPAIRAVRLTPTTPGAASLTFVSTPYPGLVVHGGLLHDFAFPVCGCDACDESVTSVADELEATVQAVVSGGYREDVRESAGEVWISYRLTTADGSRSARGPADASARARTDIRAAAARLDALPGGWVAWRSRSGSDADR